MNVKTGRFYENHSHIENCCELAQTRLGLAAAGVGITFVLSKMQILSAKGVIYRPITGEFPTLKLALAWRQDESSPVVHEFLKYL
uniref:LysR substrate-binding domain-containing protein n=1 Tax=Oscillatoriales cyanobacterium SpSt-418 TaxID=2282169 RepID=A0A7C3KHV9_9CYAN